MTSFEEDNIISDVDVNDDTWAEPYDCNSDGDDYVFDEDYEKRGQRPVERSAYWESQQALLQEVLERYRAVGSKLREEVGRIIEIAKADPSLYDCGDMTKSYSESDRWRRSVVKLLCEHGFDATLCTSSWKNIYELEGTHEYIELMARTAKWKKPIRLVIELQFREEFHMSKRCDQEYKNLINQLPETYIGIRGYLNAMVSIACDATKRHMWEKNMHMGAWRTRRFMQMKWSGSSPSSSVELVPLIFASSRGVRKQSMSPITSYFLDNHSTNGLVLT